MDAQTPKGIRHHAVDLSFEGKVEPNPRFEVSPKHIIVTFKKADVGDWLGLPNAKRGPAKKGKRKKDGASSGEFDETAELNALEEQNAMLEAAHQAADAKNREDAAAMLATEAEEAREKGRALASAAAKKAAEEEASARKAAEKKAEEEIEDVYTPGAEKAMKEERKKIPLIQEVTSNEKPQFAKKGLKGFLNRKEEAKVKPVTEAKIVTKPAPKPSPVSTPPVSTQAKDPNKLVPGVKDPKLSDETSLVQVLEMAEASVKAREAREEASGAVEDNASAPEKSERSEDEPAVIQKAQELLEAHRPKEVLALLSDQIVADLSLTASRKGCVCAASLQMRAHAKVMLEDWSGAVAEFEAARAAFHQVYKNVGYDRKLLIETLKGQVSVILAAVRMSDPMRSCIEALRGEALSIEAQARVIRAKGGKDMTLDDARDCVNAFAEAMLLFSKIGDVPNSGQAAFNCAKVHYSHGDASAAACAAASAATSFVIVNKLSDAAAAMRLQGLAKAKSKDYKAAGDLLEASIKLAAENKLPEQVALSSAALAELMPNGENQQVGYETAAGAFKAAGREIEEAKILTKLAESILQKHMANPEAWKSAGEGYDDDMGPVDKAMQNLERAMMILKTSKENIAIGDAHMTFGLAHTLRGEVGNAAIHFKACLECKGWAASQPQRAEQARLVLSRMGACSTANGLKQDVKRGIDKKEGGPNQSHSLDQSRQSSYEREKKMLEEQKTARKASIAKRVEEERLKMETEEREFDDKIARLKKDAVNAKGRDSDEEEILEEPLKEEVSPAHTKEAKEQNRGDVDEAKKIEGTKKVEVKMKARKDDEAFKAAEINKAFETKKVDNLKIADEAKKADERATAKKDDGVQKVGKTEDSLQKIAMEARNIKIDASVMSELAARVKVEEEELVRKEATIIEKKKRDAANPDLKAKKAAEEKRIQDEVLRELTEEKEAEMKRIAERRAREETAEKLNEAETAARKARGKESFELDTQRKAKLDQLLKRREEERKELAKAHDFAKKINSKVVQGKSENPLKAAAPQRVSSATAQHNIMGITQEGMPNKDAGDKDTNVDVIVDDEELTEDDILELSKECGSSCIRGVKNPFVNAEKIGNRVLNDENNDNEDDEIMCVQEDGLQGWISGAPHPSDASDEIKDDDDGDDDDDNDDEIPLCVQEDGLPGWISGVPNPYVQPARITSEKQTDTSKAHSMQAQSIPIDDKTWVTEYGCGGGIVPVYIAELAEEGAVLRLSISLPEVTTASELDFEVSETDMVLTGKGYELKLAFTKRMDEDCVKAAFDKATRKMVLIVGFP